MKRSKVSIDAVFKLNGF